MSWQLRRKVLNEPLKPLFQAKLDAVATVGGLCCGASPLKATAQLLESTQPKAQIQLWPEGKGGMNAALPAKPRKAGTEKPGIVRPRIEAAVGLLAAGTAAGTEIQDRTRLHPKTPLTRPEGLAQ